MKDTDQFKKKLADEREVLVKELNNVGTIKNEGASDWQAKPDDTETSLPDANEVSDHISSYENNNALVLELEGQLHEVDIALGKIEKGTYGVCETCGKEIEIDRLEAYPSARTCKAHM